MNGREVTLLNDCEATRIPSGEVVTLPVGFPVVITQALGGSVTVRADNGLFRIAAETADALGPEVAAKVKADADAISSDAGFSEERVWDALRQCFDPEIPINIVDLGLIYDLSSEALDNGLYRVSVKMTLTATGCGMGPTIAADAQSKIEALPSVESAGVEIVWDPQWTPHMISPEGRRIMGLE